MNNSVKSAIIGSALMLIGCGGPIGSGQACSVDADCPEGEVCVMVIENDNEYRGRCYMSSPWNPRSSFSNFVKDVLGVGSNSADESSESDES